MKKELFLLSFLLLSTVSTAQQTLTLEDCYNRAEQHYPLSVQTQLLAQKSVYEIATLDKSRLPKVDLNAQTTYQSDVIGLPAALPGVVPLNKDQYRATLDVNQLIYNGGLIGSQAKLKEVQTKTSQQQVAVKLYQLKNSINYYYFSILLLQEKEALLQSKNELLLSKIKEVKSGVQNGALLPASELVLEAERTKIKQQQIEIDFERLKMTQSLAELTFTEISPATTLTHPHSSVVNINGKRPELAWYDLQKEQLEFSKSMLSKSSLPKISAFGQAGYGNPGLNMLDNSFQSFYILGLRANWNVFDWGKNKKEKFALDIAKEIIQSEKETFEMNTTIELQQIDNEIRKIKQLLESDVEMIQTREKIVESSDIQMKNGVITTAEYLSEFINLFEAKNALKTRQVQLSLAKSNYEIIKGK
ncbi:MAG TPA: TolC family protein [Flavobacterium sp.]|nr:TolC family protein [Flavobacterium sp.]